jgi:GNAT superfamily N-acetyltransferase
MIRPGRVDDYEAIKKLVCSVGIDRNQLDNRAYRVLLQKRGFLLFPSLEEKAFQAYLQKLFLVYEDEGDVVGYTIIDSEQEEEMEAGSSRLFWFQKELEPIYFAHPHATIKVIAALPAPGRRGVGAALLQAAVERIKQRGAIPYLFSSVVSSPITNFPSMLFHEKMGFDRVAFTNYPEFHLLKNYQSILYGKRL